jgi:hypothetical protein
MRLFSSFLITLLVPLLAAMPVQAEFAQQGNGSQPSLLKIRLDDGSKATVEANSVSNGYSVLVTDASGKPVSDAAVAIHLPEEGAGGVFANGEHAVVIYTDASGVAKFPQVNWGSTTGSLSFRVTAVKGELHAGELVEQTVVAVGARTPAAPVAPFPSSEAPTSKVTTPTPKVETPPPGVPVSVAAVMPESMPQTMPQAMPQTTSPQASPQTTPAAKPDSVSVVNTSGSKAGGGISKKWVIIGVVLAGIGLGTALALAGGKSSSSSTNTSGTTIGSPTVNVGH